MMNLRRMGSSLRLLLATVSLVAIVACSDEDPVGPPGSVVLTPEGLLDVPTQLTIDGYTYSVWAYLWRDFQPITPPGGKPLTAIVRIVEADSRAIPDGVVIDFLWVVNGAETWATELTNEERPFQPDHIVEKVARNGPKWGPGIEVDVVVSVNMGGAECHRLLAMNQMIRRTD